MKNKVLFLSAITFLAAFCAATPLHAQTYAAVPGSDSKSTTPVDEHYDTSGGPVRFTFKYNTGDHYRILSTVNEDVFVNMNLDHRSVILNRISVNVTKANDDGSAAQEATFMTSEEATGVRTGAHFSWGEEYKSIFTRSSLGVYTIGDEYFMPVVRDVPVFPNKEIVPGETWTANGHEAHDLRTEFKIEKPYKVPFTATYTYLGTIKKTSSNKKEQTYAASSVTPNTNVNQLETRTDVLYVFSVKYSLYYESPVVQQKEYHDYPATTMGFSDQTIYWDAEKGAIDHYRENFRILMETAYGNLFEFRGDAHAEVTDFVQTNTDNDVEKVQKEVDKLGLENVTVKHGDKGLTISLEDIKFKADSAELLDSEMAKLKQIATILAAYPDNDILVTGHTALAGTESVRQQLSEERAEAVADYLVQLKVRDRYHIFTQGFGATKPVADNSTEAGKAKNRRVEITIMDK
jgi:outer membrane protein OmpA-like peptidoglycan-associated protein